MTTPTPLPLTQDHDVLIEVRTLVNVLLREVSDLKTRTSEQLLQKADRSEILKLENRIEDLHSHVKDTFERSNERQEDTQKDLKRLYWFLGIGYGVIIVFQAILPYLLRVK